MIRTENSFTSSPDSDNFKTDHCRNECKEIINTYYPSRCIVEPFDNMISSETLSEVFFTSNGLAQKSRQKCKFLINSLKKTNVIKQESSFNNECLSLNFEAYFQSHSEYDDHSSKLLDEEKNHSSVSIDNQSQLPLYE